MPYANSHLAKGFPLPIIHGFTLHNGFIICSDSRIMVCSDVAYKESNNFSQLLSQLVDKSRLHFLYVWKCYRKRKQESVSPLLYMLFDLFFRLNLSPLVCVHCTTEFFEQKISVYNEHSQLQIFYFLFFFIFFFLRWLANYIPFSHWLSMINIF
jgi:hypothetical protein